MSSPVKMTHVCMLFVYLLAALQLVTATGSFLVFSPPTPLGFSQSTGSLSIAPQPATINGAYISIACFDSATGLTSLGSVSGSPLWFAPGVQAAQTWSYTAPLIGQNTYVTCSYTVTGPDADAGLYSTPATSSILVIGVNGYFYAVNAIPTYLYPGQSRYITYVPSVTPPADVTLFMNCGGSVYEYDYSASTSNQNVDNLITVPMTGSSISCSFSLSGNGAQYFTAPSGATITILPRSGFTINSEPTSVYAKTTSSAIIITPNSAPVTPYGVSLQVSCNQGSVASNSLIWYQVYATSWTYQAAAQVADVSYPYVDTCTYTVTGDNAFQYDPPAPFQITVQLQNNLNVYNNPKWLWQGSSSGTVYLELNQYPASAFTVQMDCGVMNVYNYQAGGYSNVFTFTPSILYVQLYFLAPYYPTDVICSFTSSGAGANQFSLPKPLKMHIYPTPDLWFNFQNVPETMTFGATTTIMVTPSSAPGKYGVSLTFGGAQNDPEEGNFICDCQNPMQWNEGDASPRYFNFTAPYDQSQSYVGLYPSVSGYNTYRYQPPNSIYFPVVSNILGISFASPMTQQTYSIMDPTSDGGFSSPVTSYTVTLPLTVQALDLYVNYIQAGTVIVSMNHQVLGRPDIYQPFRLKNIADSFTLTFNSDLPGAGVVGENVPYTVTVLREAPSIQSVQFYDCANAPANPVITPPVAPTPPGIPVTIIATPFPIGDFAALDSVTGLPFNDVGSFNAYQRQYTLVLPRDLTCLKVGVTTSGDSSSVTATYSLDSNMPTSSKHLVSQWYYTIATPATSSSAVLNVHSEVNGDYQFTVITPDPIGVLDVVFQNSLTREVYPLLYTTITTTVITVTSSTGETSQVTTQTTSTNPTSFIATIHDYTVQLPASAVTFDCMARFLVPDQVYLTVPGGSNNVYLQNGLFATGTPFTWGLNPITLVSQSGVYRFTFVASTPSATAVAQADTIGLTLFQVDANGNNVPISGNLNPAVASTSLTFNAATQVYQTEVPHTVSMISLAPDWRYPGGTIYVAAQALAFTNFSFPKSDGLSPPIALKVGFNVISYVNPRDGTGWYTFVIYRDAPSSVFTESNAFGCANRVSYINKICGTSFGSASPFFVANSNTWFPQTCSYECANYAYLLNGASIASTSKKAKHTSKLATSTATTPTTSTSTSDAGISAACIGCIPIGKYQDTFVSFFDDCVRGAVPQAGYDFSPAWKLYDSCSDMRPVSDYYPTNTKCASLYYTLTYSCDFDDLVPNVNSCPSSSCGAQWIQYKSQCLWATPKTNQNYQQLVQSYGGCDAYISLTVTPVLQFVQPSSASSIPTVPGTVTVQWTDSEFRARGLPVDGWTVQGAADAGFTTSVTTLCSGPLTNLTCATTGLTPFQVLYVRVQAYNQYTTSPWSTAVYTVASGAPFPSVGPLTCGYHNTSSLIVQFSLAQFTAKVSNAAFNGAEFGRLSGFSAYLFPWVADQDVNLYVVNSTAMPFSASGGVMLSGNLSFTTTAEAVIDANSTTASFQFSQLPHNTPYMLYVRARSNNPIAGVISTGVVCSTAVVPGPEEYASLPVVVVVPTLGVTPRIIDTSAAVAPVTVTLTFSALNWGRRYVDTAVAAFDYISFGDASQSKRSYGMAYPQRAQQTAVGDNTIRNAMSIVMTLDPKQSPYNNAGRLVFVSLTVTDILGVNQTITAEQFSNATLNSPPPTVLNNFITYTDPSCLALQAQVNDACGFNIQNGYFNQGKCASAKCAQLFMSFNSGCLSTAIFPPSIATTIAVPVSIAVPSGELITTPRAAASYVIDECVKYTALSSYYPIFYADSSVSVVPDPSNAGFAATLIASAKDTVVVDTRPVCFQLADSVALTCNINPLEYTVGEVCTAICSTLYRSFADQCLMQVPSTNSYWPLQQAFYQSCVNNAPVAPSAMPQIAAILDVGTGSGIGLNVHWTYHSNLAGLPVYFIVYWSDDSATPNKWSSNVGDATAITLSNLNAETSYYIRIQVFNEEFAGPTAIAEYVTGSGRPASVVDIQVNERSQSAHSINISWAYATDVGTASVIPCMVVDMQGSCEPVAGSLPTSTTSYMFTNLMPNQQYTLGVVIYQNDRARVASIPATVTTRTLAVMPTAPSAPVAVRVDATSLLVSATLDQDPSMSVDTILFVLQPYSSAILPDDTTPLMMAINTTIDRTRLPQTVTAVFTGLIYNTVYMVNATAYSSDTGFFSLPSVASNISTAPTTPSAVLQPFVQGAVDFGLTAQWIMPSRDGGAPVTHYIVSISSDADNFATVQNFDTTLTVFWLFEFSVGSWYSVSITPVNSAGAGQTVTVPLYQFTEDANPIGVPSNAFAAPAAPAPAAVASVAAPITDTSAQSSAPAAPTNVVTLPPFQLFESQSFSVDSILPIGDALANFNGNAIIELSSTIGEIVNPPSFFNGPVSDYALMSGVLSSKFYATESQVGNSGNLTLSLKDSLTQQSIGNVTLPVSILSYNHELIVKAPASYSGVIALPGRPTPPLVGVTGISLKDADQSYFDAASLQFSVSSGQLMVVAVPAWVSALESGAYIDPSPSPDQPVYSSSFALYGSITYINMFLKSNLLFINNPSSTGSTVLTIISDDFNNGLDISGLLPPYNISGFCSRYYPACPTFPQMPGDGRSVKRVQIPVTFTCANAAAPVLQSARVADDLMSYLFTFDVPVFLAPSADSSLCRFLSNSTRTALQLLPFMGASNIAQAEDSCVLIAPNVIQAKLLQPVTGLQLQFPFTVALAKRMVRACDTSSIFTNQTALLQGPTKPYTSGGYITGPTSTYTCGDFPNYFLNATNNMNSVPTQVSWGVVCDSDDIPLASYISQDNTFMMLPFLYSIEGTCTITASYTNFLGQRSALVTLPVQVTYAPDTQYMIAGGSQQSAVFFPVRNTVASSSLKQVAYVSLDGKPNTNSNSQCSTPTFTPTKFQYSIDPPPNPANLQGVNPNPTAIVNGSSGHIDTQFLNQNVPYQVNLMALYPYYAKPVEKSIAKPVVTGSIDGNWRVVASMTLTVTPPALSLSLSASPATSAIYPSQALSLTTVYRDDNYGIVSQSTPTYFWSCITSTGAACVSLHASSVIPVDANGGSLRIPSGTLSVGVYTFSVYARADTRKTKTRSFTVEVLPPVARPVFKFTCPSNGPLRSFDSLTMSLDARISAALPDGSSIPPVAVITSYSWSAVRVGGGASIDLSSFNTSSATINSFNTPFFFASGAKYQFNVSGVVAVGGYPFPYSFVCSQRILADPVIGALVVTPNSGTALATTYQLIAQNVQVANGATPTYRFFYMSGKDVVYLPCSASLVACTSNRWSGILPSVANGNQIQVGVKVMGASGEWSTATTTIVNSPNESLGSVADLLNFFTQSMIGNYGDAGMTVANIQLVAGVRATLPSDPATSATLTASMLQALQMVFADLSPPVAINAMYAMMNGGYLTSTADVVTLSSMIKATLATLSSSSAAGSPVTLSAADKDHVVYLISVSSSPATVPAGTSSAPASPVSGNNMARRLLYVAPSQDYRLAVQASIASYSQLLSLESITSLSGVGSSWSATVGSTSMQVTRVSTASGTVTVSLAGVDLTINVVSTDPGVIADVQLIVTTPNPFNWPQNAAALSGRSVTIQITDTTGNALSSDLAAAFSYSVSQSYDTKECDADICQPDCMFYDTTSSYWTPGDLNSWVPYSGTVSCNTASLGTIGVIQSIQVQSYIKAAMATVSQSTASSSSGMAADSGSGDNSGAAVNASSSTGGDTGFWASTGILGGLTGVTGDAGSYSSSSTGSDAFLTADNSDSTTSLSSRLENKKVIGIAIGAFFLGVLIVICIVVCLWNRRRRADAAAEKSKVADLSVLPGAASGPAATRAAPAPVAVVVHTSQPEETASPASSSPAIASPTGATSPPMAEFDPKAQNYHSKQQFQQRQQVEYVPASTQGSDEDLAFPGAVPAGTAVSDSTPSAQSTVFCDHAHAPLTVFDPVAASRATPDPDEVVVISPPIAESSGPAFQTPAQAVAQQRLQQHHIQSQQMTQQYQQQQQSTYQPDSVMLTPITQSAPSGKSTPSRNRLESRMPMKRAVDLTQAYSGSSQ